MWRLSLLAKAGYQVAPGFGISNSALQLFLKNNSLNHSNLLRLEPTTSRRSIMAGKLPTTLERQIQEAYASLLRSTSARLVIARSSASMEDSRSASFAGVFESKSGIRTFRELTHSIKRCWSSLYDKKARNLIEALRYEGVYGMGVIVQQMISAKKSGVCFTQEPVKKSKRVVIEACRGLGDMLVSGKVTPERYIVSPDGKVLVHTRSYQTRAHHVEGNRLAWKTIQESIRSTPILTESEVRAIANMGGKLESFFGLPQDIEWSIDDCGLWILQSRDILA